MRKTRSGDFQIADPIKTAVCKPSLLESEDSSRRGAAGTSCDEGVAAPTPCARVTGNNANAMLRDFRTSRSTARREDGKRCGGEDIEFAVAFYADLQSEHSVLR